MSLLALALRNARRNTRRSLLTAAMITLGVALLTVAMAWIEGVLGGALDTAARSIGPVRVVAPEYARREALMPLDAHLADVDALATRAKGVAGVRAAYPRVSMPVTITADDTLGERFALVQGAPLAYYTEELDLDARLTAGTLPAGEDDALLGRALAEQLQVRPGAEVVLLGQTQDGSLAPAKVRVAGVVSLGNAQQERQVWASLAKVRWMADVGEGATELLVFGPERGEAGALAERLRETLHAPPGDAAATVVQAWDERPPFSELLVFADAIHAVAGGVIVFITALGVFNTMLMSVMERTGEIGVLRALGMRRREVVGLFLLEATSIALVGGILGAALGAAGGFYLQEVGVDLGSAVDRLNGAIPLTSTVYGKVSANVVGGAVGLGLLMAVVGGWLPALRASRIPPVEAMRARR
jgi:putative ABC transport system permease protein